MIHAFSKSSCARYTFAPVIWHLCAFGVVLYRVKHSIAGDYSNTTAWRMWVVSIYPNVLVLLASVPSFRIGKSAALVAGAGVIWCCVSAMCNVKHIVMQ